ncbi:MAG: hypothetical protein J7K49_03400 [Thaumarchaeota archaeon]|nr:hypothetical protein [Nitrososphaerota archaeon]
MNKRILIALMALTLASILILSQASAQAEQTLIVKVVNPLGEELKGMEVLLIKGAESRRFMTNASGYAEFKHIAPGEYTVKVVSKNITLAEEKVKVPEQLEITLTAKIASIKLKLTNLDGDPVSNLLVNLNSSSGAIVFTAKSNKEGIASFDQVPYSELQGVGEYNLSVNMEALSIYREDIRVDAPEISKNISLPLLNLRITVTDLEGDPVPKVSLTLKSAGYSTHQSSTNGTIIISNLPSSKIEGVGAYALNLTMRTKAGDVPIHVEERQFTSSESIDLVTDLAKLTVKVTDDAGNPLGSVKVVLSNSLAEDFADAETNEEGVAEFKYVPLSFGEIRAGKYLIKTVRGRVVIGEVEFEVSKPRDSVKLIAERKSVAIRLTDFNGKPLAGYTIKIIDELTGREFDSITDSTGKASFKLFFGPYDLRVLKDEKEIYAKSMNIQEELVDLNLKDVNFPLKIIVKDALGNPLRSALIKISTGNTVLKEDMVNSKPIEVMLPYPTYLRCDIYTPDGKLLQRNTFFANSPGIKEITLKDYIEFNGFLSLETIALIIVTAITAVSIAVFFATIYRRMRTKG